MKSVFILFAALMLSLTASAQDVSSLVPSGFEKIEMVNGDMNNDGRDDVAVIIRSLDEEKIVTRDDGYTYNTNTPRLVILFANPDGSHKEWKHYDTLLPAMDEFISYDYSLKLTPKGALIISISSFASAGSYSNDTYSQTYRFQNGDFYLIGADASSLQRQTLDITEYSWNFLSGKQQIKKSNAGEDAGKTVRESWKSIGRKPLKKLGTIDMFEFYVD